MLTVLDRPICAVCRRPVERMTRWNNDAKATVTFTVECHGAAEATELTAYQVHQARQTGPDGIQFGLAFNSQTLPTQELVPDE